MTQRIEKMNSKICLGTMHTLKVVKPIGNVKFDFNNSWIIVIYHHDFGQ